MLAAACTHGRAAALLCRDPASTLPLPGDLADARGQVSELAGLATAGEELRAELAAELDGARSQLAVLMLKLEQSNEVRRCLPVGARCTV